MTKTTPQNYTSKSIYVKYYRKEDEFPSVTWELAKGGVLSYSI